MNDQEFKQTIQQVRQSYPNDDQSVDEDISLPRLTVPNTVSQTYVGACFDLKYLAVITCGRYEPSLFPACVVKMRIDRDTYCVISVFTSGRMVITGAASEFISIVAPLQLCYMINDISDDLNLRVHHNSYPNRVACVDLKFPIDLERLHRDYKWCSSYDPLHFYGLKLILSKLKCTAIVFSKGRNTKVNYTGIKSKSLLPAIQQTARLFERYRLS